VPVKAIEIGEFGAVLTTCTIPVALPLVVGANTTLNVLFAPGPIVIGSPVIPLIVKPVPVTFACDRDTAAAPVFDKVIVCELLLPMLTVPKLALDGLAMS
jgi:hypothetical protein